MSDDVKALIAAARRQADLMEEALGVKYDPGLMRRLADALEAAQQAPAWHLTPPPGWSLFGTHIDSPGPLEFWGEDDGGMPIWERPAQQAPAVNADGLVAEIRAAYVEYAESADFPTTKDYLEWKLAGGAEREFDSMIAEVEARGLEKASNSGDFNSMACIALNRRAQQVREGN